MSLLTSKFFQFIFSLCIVIITIAIIGGVVKDDTEASEGDLAITWINTDGDEVLAGEPIFLIDDLKPGDTYTSQVTVTNGSQFERTIALRGEQTDTLGNMAQVLHITIFHDGTALFGDPGSPKTLDDMFIESNPLGIAFAELAPQQTGTYTIEITAPASMSNTYQLNSFEFDLTIGITTEDGEVPEACEDINFDGEMITGTEGNDRLEGTPRNDLIIGLEGNDRIRGHGGDDCIVGNEGNDRLDGGIGQDIILGGTGNDEIEGGNGNDELYGNEGNDTNGYKTSMATNGLWRK